MKKTYRKITSIILFLILIFSVAVNTDLVNAATDAAFEQSIAQFPDSYKPYLRTLHASHPNWKFEAFDTGLDWNVVLDNEMVFTRNLVPNQTSSIITEDGSWAMAPTSWMDTKITGSFNWERNDWEVLSAPYWIQASREAVAYVMDPRNWMNELFIMEFMKLSYDAETQTMSSLKSMLDNTFMDCDYAIVGGSGGKTYGQVIMEAAQKYGINPLHLASRILQEKGAGRYNDATGKYVTYDSMILGVERDGTKYYNYYNIGAFGTSAEDIIRNGITEAKNEGWTSQYKALIGGASKVSTGYIEIGQDTLYFEKFSVVNPQYYYYKQYMQNLVAPLSEGLSMRNKAVSLGTFDAAYVFKIPVYDNMPSKAVSKPVKDGNPNYKAQSITVTGNHIGGTSEILSFTSAFNTDVTSYSMEVDYDISSVDIYCNTYATTTTVTGNGRKTLKSGDNVFNVICTAQNGDARKYVINIYRKYGNSLLKTLTPEIGCFNTSFSPQTTDYTMYVGYNRTSLTFSYVAENSKSSVVIRQGSTATKASGGTFTVSGLATGNNKFYIDVYPSSDTTDASQKKTYTINVVRYTNTAYDLSSYQVLGLMSDYASKDKYISGFEPGVKVSSVISEIGVTNGRVVIRDALEQVKSESDIMATGDVIRIYDVNNTVMQRLYVIIYGDIDGNGIIDAGDYRLLKEYCTGGVSLSGEFLRAANVNIESSKINDYDINSLKNYIYFNGRILQKH